MAEYISRILSLVTSPEFIVGTVIAGLLLAVVGNALYEGGKLLLGMFSARQRARNEKEKQRIEREARKCVANPSYFSMAIGMANLWSTRFSRNLTLTVSFAILMFLLATSMYPTRLQDSLTADVIDVLLRASSGLQLFRLSPMKYEFWLQVMLLIVAFETVYMGYHAQRANALVGYWVKVIVRARALLNEQTDGVSEST